MYDLIHQSGCAHSGSSVVLLSVGRQRQYIILCVVVELAAEEMFDKSDSVAS
jgi:hypothetical protein